jgi:tetratricopeptide (TPR) repeat protein
MIRLAVALALLSSPTQLARADLATIQSRNGDAAEVEGTIVNFTGKLLTIRTVSGRDQRIPSDEVLEIKTEWPAQKSEADRAFDQRQWRQAADLYAEANRVEKRVWARRLILDRWMQCFQALDMTAEAGDVFIALATSDPTTPAYRRAPLKWFGDDDAGSQKASQWLAQSNNPAAVLLGASHLISTPQREAALASLRSLSTPDRENPDLAALAEAQLWRARVASADTTEIQHWAQRIDAFDENVRAGPHLVVAQALQRIGRSEEAVLHYLRPPLLFPEQRRLAARGLDGAARLLAAIGRSAEAEELIGELLNAYPESIEATAQRRICGQ